MGFMQLRNQLINERGWSPKLATLAARYYLDVENFSESVRWCLPRPITRGFNADPMLTTHQWLAVVRDPCARGKGEVANQQQSEGEESGETFNFRPMFSWPG